MPKRATTSDSTTATPAPPPEKRPRKYSGPAKGSAEAKERMAKVRAAQYAKNNLVYAKNS